MRRRRNLRAKLRAKIGRPRVSIDVADGDGGPRAVKGDAPEITAKSTARCGKSRAGICRSGADAAPSIRLPTKGTVLPGDGASGAEPPKQAPDEQEDDAAGRSPARKRYIDSNS